MRDRAQVQAFFDANPSLLCTSSSPWHCPLALYDRMGPSPLYDTTVNVDRTLIPHEHREMLHAAWEMELIILVDNEDGPEQWYGSQIAHMLRFEVPNYE